MRTENLFNSLLVRQPPVYPRTVVRHSHYFQPISREDYMPHGRSRTWGDISPQDQADVIGAIITQARREQLTLDETALLLAVTRVESGFNPDAASANSSASGLGQFIDKTGVAYGLTDKNRFSLIDNIRALIAHMRDNLRAAKLYGVKNSEEHYAYAYALHHDGPMLNAGGLEIAQENVLPWYKRFKNWLAPYNFLPVSR